jgi:signal transduction histidine kinase
MLAAFALPSMTTNLEFHQTRERLLVGRRFLLLRPFLVGVGVLGNGLCLTLSPAPMAQKRALALAMLTTWCAFVGEAFWLKSRALTERWLLASLSLTLCALAAGALASGGLYSPLLPLLFAPVVVGFAAFARGKASAILLLLTLVVLLLLSVNAPGETFPVLPAPWSLRMLLISSGLSFALLFIGVVGLVDSHARVAEQLERMRADLLQEAEHRAVSMEKLGAQVAHEVKNPLTAVRGLVQLVQRKQSDARDHERLSVVVDQVDRALSVLQDYLSFARPFSDLKLAEVDLYALLHDVAGVVEARALERSVTVHVEGEPLWAAVDRQRLRDALLNLALNGLAAMPRGGQLRLRVRSDAHALCVEVSDSGVGMDEAELDALGTAYASSAEGGTGLGVLLARAVLSQHGGTLTYQSARGQGTCAKLELPGRASARVSARTQGRGVSG